MAKSRPTIMKRQRELARQEKRRNKASRRAAPDETKSKERPDGAGDEYDPDIAHIVPGPQPIPWADEFDDEEEEEEEESGTEKVQENAGGS